MKQLEQLQYEIQSDDWPTAIAAADALSAIGGKIVLHMLIPLLAAPARRTRDAAAIALRQMGDSDAVGPLVQRIQQMRPEEDRTTLVYALQTLDCNAYFRFLFHLALTGRYVEQVHALHILFDQEFQVTDADLREAQAELDAYTERRDRPEDTNDLIRDLIVLLDEFRQQQS